MSKKNQQEENQQQTSLAPVEKDVKGILVHLELELANRFYELAHSGNFFNKKTPTALARELIMQFLDKNTVTAETE